MVAESKRLTLCQGFSNFLQDVANFANFHRECCKFKLPGLDDGISGIGNVPFLGYGHHPLMAIIDDTPHGWGDVQLGRLNDPWIFSWDIFWTCRNFHG